MATIRQRNDRWQVIVKRQGYPTQTKTFALKKDAEKWGRQQERLIDAGEWVDRTEAQQTTLSDVIDRYGKEVTPTKRGAIKEDYFLKAFLRCSLAKYSMASINTKLISAWRDARLTEVSPSSVAREMQLLGHIFTVAIRDWGIALTCNPVTLVRKPTPNQARDRVLNNEERAALLASCATCKSPWVQPVVVFALETAARRGEILSLRWADVDLNRCIAKVDGKTGPRTIPLSSICVDMMKGLPRSVGGKVFPVTMETLSQAYIRAVARAGIKDFTFHDLRHDSLTRLAKLGLSILELRAISGHTTANMLQRYVSISAEELAGKLSRVA